MERIHKQKNLDNKDIMQGGGESYGLVKVTTCGVSGQLATEAPPRDVGYKTVTDYFPQDAVPQVQCQMHHQMTVCSASNQIAGPYCPHELLSTRGVMVLPLGHPLEIFAGSRYSNVLSDYLGNYATIRFTNNQNANAALLSAQTCPIHQQPGDAQQNLVTNTLLPDAQNLIVQASNLLAGLQAGSAEYEYLLGAINNLNAVIGSNPSLEALAGAMGQLTQAMAAIQ